LSPILDAREVQTVQGMFAGGEPLNLHLHSHAVTIGDDESGISVNVRSVQSLCSGYICEDIAMEAIILLFNSRDKAICGAYKEVNENKVGYIPRVSSVYISIKLSKILFESNNVSLDSLLQHPLVIELVSSKTLLLQYRTVIPFFWSLFQEWVLIILESTTKRIQVIFPRYHSSIGCPTTADDRVTLNTVIREVLLKIIQHSDSESFVDSSWAFVYSDPEDVNDKLLLVGDAQTVVYDRKDSGVFVLYAMETDYFNAPFYAPERRDWDNFRIRIAYCLLSKQLYN